MSNPNNVRTDNRIMNHNELVDSQNEDQTDSLLSTSSSVVKRNHKKIYGSTDEENLQSVELDSDILELPKVVRESVPLEDDPSIPVVTFRYFILSTIFIVPGAFLDTMNSYRTTSAVYSIFFVQIVSHWAGKWMAKTLPKKNVNVCGFEFNLNPGPWSIKETAMITITANSGATGNLATNAISLAELHFNEKVNAAIAILFMWAIVFIGYSYAAIAKCFVLYDPKFTWPQALMQTTLLQSQAKADRDSKHGSIQMKVFFYVLLAVTIWEFLPEFAFPLTSSLAILCWIAPYNKTVNFIGSGMGGMGVLNFSLDWANITSSIMLYPYWIQIIQFLGFILGAWIMIPLVKWGGVTSFKHGLMSNSLFLNNGTRYPTNELLTDDLTLNMTAYNYYGPVHLGAQRAWNMFFDYAAYISGIVWVILFGYDQMKSSLSVLRNTYTTENQNGGFTSIHLQYTDRLNKLQSKYEEVPMLWYLILFIISFSTLMFIFLSGQMFLPWWCCIVALALGSIIVTPLSWLYALSNFQLAIGTFNELFYGYMVQNIKSVHPVSAVVFGAISGSAWYRAQYHLLCMRLGFYIHLPPKAVFFSQIYGEIIGVPFNYIALRWVLDTKREYLDGTKEDPLHQWTGQTITSYHTNAINYVILGPKRLFYHYPLLPYGFLLGAIAPVALYILHRKFPNSRVKFRLWNTTVFFSTLSTFYGNLSTGYTSKFIGGTVTMYWAYNYRHSLWKSYNYILAAAFDTGYNFAVLLIFLLFSFGRTVRMPHWWGNNEQSVERCFAL